MFNKNLKKKIIIEDKIVTLENVNETIVPPVEGIKNLFLIDKLSNIIWTAEIPEDYPYGYYDDIDYINGKLLAWCGSTQCEISLDTGKIIRSGLVK